MQIRFPFGIGKLRLVDVLIICKIGRSSQTSQTAGPDIGERGKQGCDQENYQKEKQEDKADYRVPFDRMDNTDADPLCCDCGIFGLFPGFTGSLGILPFQFLFLPYPGNRMFLQLRVVAKSLPVSKSCVCFC